MGNVDPQKGDFSSGAVGTTLPRRSLRDITAFVRLVDNMGVLHTKEMHLKPVIDWVQVTFKNFEIEKIIKEIFKENFQIR